ncbi:MAG: hypothetical protein NTY45_08265 [Elusimicrobia bacterium]|nr:hypothetical protein [Elusimicrobiota bacterium]
MLKIGLDKSSHPGIWAVIPARYDTGIEAGKERAAVTGKRPKALFLRSTGYWQEQVRGSYAGLLRKR